jgi:hypothetical protein
MAMRLNCTWAPSTRSMRSKISSSGSPIVAGSPFLAPGDNQSSPGRPSVRKAIDALEFPQ